MEAEWIQILEIERANKYNKFRKVNSVQTHSVYYSSKFYMKID